MPLRYRRWDHDACRVPGQGRRRPSLPPRANRVPCTWQHEKGRGLQRLGARDVWGWSVAVLTQPPSRMPPLFGAASRCPRCNDRVYAAEQVIGPLSKMYHRHCLKCVVCQRRLDSVSLLEHDGEPYCSNCHRTHLGQGKDSFGTAVPVKPQHDPSTKSRPFKAVSDTNLHGRRPLPMAPSGSQEPLTVPASVSVQSGSSNIPTPSSTAGTPACARCHTPVCTCA